MVFGLFPCYYVKIVLRFVFWCLVCCVWWYVLYEGLFFFLLRRRGCILSYPNDALSDDIDALISGADALSAAADSIGTITSGSDVLVSNFDHVEEVFDNLQAFLSELKSGHFYTPVGALMPFAGTSAYVPNGWLVCDGRSYPASGASADLQTILNAAGFSALPDLQGRTIIGVGTAISGATLTGVLAGVQGASTKTLSTSELPSHTHSISAWATTDGAGSHYHTINSPVSGIKYYTDGIAGGSRSYLATAASGGVTYNSANVSGNTSTTGGHDHTIPGTTTQGTGDGSSFSLTQPSMGLNYIIKN